MKKTLIIYGYKYKLLLHFSFWFILNMIFNLQLGLPYFCESNPWDKPYDDRTCYEIMNEPDPYKDYDEDVARIDYYYNKGEIIPYVDCYNMYEPDSSSTNSSSYNSDSEESEESEESENSETESGSVSDSSRANQINYLSNANDILNDYMQKTSTCESKQQFLLTSIEYIKELMPSEIWNTGEHDIGKERLGPYLDNLSRTVSIKTEADADNFIKFYSILTTYNTLLTFPEHKDDIKILEVIFDSSVKVTVENFFPSE